MRRTGAPSFALETHPLRRSGTMPSSPDSKIQISAIFGRNILAAPATAF
jgi:hypothetical protein